MAQKERSSRQKRERRFERGIGKTERMKNLCIIGCGYVGREAAERWRKKGHHVTATTRHSEKLDSLSKVAQKCLIYKGGNEEELIPLILNNEVLLVSIAADSPDQYVDAYLENANLIRHLA